VVAAARPRLRPPRPSIPQDSSAWHVRMWRRLGSAFMRRDVPPPDVVDVTTFPGGTAVLSAGDATGAARLVDLYMASGEYVETMQLSHGTLRIAGVGGRLIVLGVQGDDVYLGSYVLPARVRALATLPEAASVVPPVPSGAAF